MDDDGLMEGGLSRFDVSTFWIRILSLFQSLHSKQRDIHLFVVTLNRNRHKEMDRAPDHQRDRGMAIEVGNETDTLSPPMLLFLMDGDIKSDWSGTRERLEGIIDCFDCI